MNGEEISGGRAFAHVVTGNQKGTSYELASLGRFAWENSVAHANAGDKTILIGLNDGTPGQVYVYIGDKKSTGNPVERAGLVGGSLYGIKVTSGGSNYANTVVARENNGPINGAFVLAKVPTSPTYVGNGAQLQTNSDAVGITKFARPEDGAWDTLNPRVFYFVVTGATIDGKGQSARLYRLTFDNIPNPTSGTIDLIIDRAALPLNPGDPTFAQFDNITVADDGSVIVQEDPGNSPYLAKIWSVNPGTKTATPITVSDPARFAPPTPAPFSQDEESSGVIEVTELVKAANWYEPGRRYFLADLQAHYEIAGELVEGGQLYMIASPK
jgi:secreted PhoX family phosphatase